MIIKNKLINPYNKKAIGETNLSTHKEVEDKILLAKKAYLADKNAGLYEVNRWQKLAGL